MSELPPDASINTTPTTPPSSEAEAIVQELVRPEHEVPEQLPLEEQDKEGHKLRLAEITIQRTGLYDDVKNIWNYIGQLRKADDIFTVADLMPIILKQDLPHYAEYVSATRKEPILSYVLENSNPEKVREFDTVVDQVNIFLAAARVDSQSGGSQTDFYAEKMLNLYDQAMALIKGDGENA